MFVGARTLGAAAITLFSFLTVAAAQSPSKSAARGKATPTSNADSTKRATASSDIPQCASGMVLYPAAFANSSGAAAMTSGASMPSIPAIPSATGLLAGAAKNKLLKRGDSAAPAAAPAAAGTGSASPFICVTPAQAQAYLQAMQTASAASAIQSPEQAAAAQKAAMKSVVTSALAATPQGMLVTGAVAAAPTAGNAVKSLAGRFSRGDSKDGMIHDLRQGRLQLKSIHFVSGSDEMADGFEQTIAVLSDALQSVDGQFALVVLPESDGKSAPDVETARRRMANLAAHLQLAGIGADRVVVADEAIGAHTPGGRTLGAHIAGDKSPKVGDARVELVRVGGAKP